MYNLLAGFLILLGVLTGIPPNVSLFSGFQTYGRVFYYVIPPPGNRCVGVPCWDHGDMLSHGCVTMSLRDAASPLLTQVTHVRCRGGRKGNVATVRWNDFGSNGNSVT